MIIMFVVSHFYPRKTFADKGDALKVDMHGWKYAYHLSAALVVTTIFIYIVLGHY
jgi:solute:Na+ symporter, SSS family